MNSVCRGTRRNTPYQSLLVSSKVSSVSHQIGRNSCHSVCLSKLLTLVLLPLYFFSLYIVLPILSKVGAVLLCHGGPAIEINLCFSVGYNALLQQMALLKTKCNIFLATLKMLTDEPIPICSVFLLQIKLNTMQDFTNINKFSQSSLMIQYKGVVCLSTGTLVSGCILLFSQYFVFRTFLGVSNPEERWLMRLNNQLSFSRITYWCLQTAPDKSCIVCL